MSHDEQILKARQVIDTFQGMEPYYRSIMYRDLREFEQPLGFVRMIKRTCVQKQIVGERAARYLYKCFANEIKRIRASNE